MAVQEEELQEEDQEVETWTGNVKACTCDCESAESPTRLPAVVQPVLLTSPSPPPPQGHPLDCMPGEVACYKFKTLNDEQPEDTAGLTAAARWFLAALVSSPPLSLFQPGF